MSSLKEVVLELQEQNRQLDDVGSDIRALVRETIEARKKAERDAGRQEEARREAANKRAAGGREETRVRARTKEKDDMSGGFLTNLLKGMGLGGLLSGITGALGTGAGMLGGMTLGGLFGRAIGKLFWPALGAFFGVKYLDKWIDPLVDKITGDDATWTMFGQQIDASKIVSGFAGALGVIFGPKLLGAAVKSWFERDATEKGPSLRQKFLRRLGLSAILLTAGQFAGDWLKGQGSGEALANAVSAGLTGAGIGYQLFGVKGMIIGALAAIAYTGLKALTDYLNTEREKIVAEQIEKAKEALRVFDDPNQADLDRAQSLLDAKRAILEADRKAAAITDKEQKAAAQELARFQRAAYNKRLAEGARLEQQAQPEGQLLITEEYAAYKMRQAGQLRGGKVSEPDIKDYLMDVARSDLTAEDIKGMDPDDLVMFLENSLRAAKQQNNLVSTYEDDQKAILEVYNQIRARAGVKVKDVVTDIARPRMAQQSTGSARIGMTRGGAGDELNALDAVAAQRAMMAPPVVISDNSVSTTQVRNDATMIGETVASARDATVYPMP